MSMRATQFLSAADVERAARRRLPRCVYEYVRGGTEDERALRRNAAAFERYGFVPRGLRNVQARTPATTLWGRTLAMPVGIGPTGMAGLVRHEADLALARAARQAQVPFVISGSSNVALERLQAEAPGCWYQAYLPHDRARIDRIMRRVEAAGIEVVVVTIDTCVAGNRENNARVDFRIPFRMTPRLVLDGLAHPGWTLDVLARTLLASGVPRFANLFEEIGPPITEEPAHGLRTGRDALDWDDMRWLRQRWPGRLVLKGVMHPDDARQAVDAGMDAVLVSNHGGRQMDATIAPFEALPAVLGAVPTGFPVFVDGGFRRGTDVLKAIALGAGLVFLGRAPLFGAAVAGQAGVDRVLQLLREEIDRDMALLGCASLADVVPDLLR